MHFDLTNYQNTIAAFAVVLVIIFALAAFLDNRLRKAELLRGIGFNHNPNFPLESDDNDGTSNLYLRHADLNSTDPGTAEEHITFRGDALQTLEEN
jgi:hypothetical protein